MVDQPKHSKADESRPTESSKAETFPEPGDIADQAQRDDPNNYTPGNESNRKNPTRPTNEDKVKGDDDADETAA
jgi:hypothetical protein